MCDIFLKINSKCPERKRGKESEREAETKNESDLTKQTFP